MKKRIVCMLLALLLLVGMLPVGVFAEGKTEYEKNETGTAVFNSVLSGQPAYITDDPTLGLNASGDYNITVDEALLSQTFYIADSYVGESEYWYKLEPLDGETMPEKLSAKPWVYQNDIPTGGNVDALIITPPANTCRCCESCTGAEDCECGCGECDYCEPVTTDPTTPTDPSQPECGCCDACIDAEGCTCGCEPCKFCEKEDPEVNPSVTDPVTNTVIYAESIPSDVTPVVDTNADVSAQLVKYGIPASNVVFGWDISLKNADNTEYQPDGGAWVKIPVSASAGTLVGILHNDTYMGLTQVLSDGTVEFYTDSFSEFVGFTVDFHYNGVDFSIPGLSEILLSELFEIMEIEENAFAATSVVFSDNSLIGVQQQADGDWLLTSLEAFQTEETLVITFTGGRSIVIDVTDASGVTKDLWDGAGFILYNTPLIGNNGHTVTFKLEGDDTDNITTTTTVTNFATANRNRHFTLYFPEKANYWYDVSVSDSDFNPSLDDTKKQVNLEKVNGGTVTVTRHKRSNIVFQGNTIEVDQQRYATLGDVEERTVKVILNEDENNLMAEEKAIFPNLGDDIAECQLDVFHIQTSMFYYYKFNNQGKRVEHTGKEIRNDVEKYNDNTGETYTYDTNTNTYTVRLLSRYNVVFHANGGGGNMNNQGFIWGVEQRLNPNKFTAPTYTVTYVSNGGSEYSPASVNTKFGGWKYGEKVYGDNANIPANGALTAEPGGLVDLYAKWDPVSSVTLPNPTKDGYEFKGWYTDDSFDEATEVTGTTYTPTSNVTLYAKWEPNIYKVTLNNMGATTAGTANYWYKYNTVINNVYYYTNSNCTTALANSTITKPTKTGYTFKGYYTGANGSGTQYVNENGLCVNNLYKSRAADTTLYAYWEANTNTAYKVNHYIEDLAGSTYSKHGDTENKTGTTDAALTVASFAKTIDGFTYKEGKVGDSVVTSTTILPDGSRVINLYYTRNSYKVTTNKGTGISEVSGAGTYKYGATVKIDATVSDGYMWRNWTGHSTQTTKNYEFTMPASAVTYTANADKISYSISFDVQGATSGSIADKTLAWDEEYALPTPEKKFTIIYNYNYTGTDGKVKTTADVAEASFLGWKNGDTTYAGGAKVSKLSDTNGDTVPLVASWTNVPEIELLTPTRDGYTFGGWYTDAACTDANKVKARYIRPTEDMTLYAKWTPDTREVTYKYEGTVPSGAPAVPAAADVRVGDPVTVATTANITGYTFSGWTTTDAEIKDGKFTMPDKAVTLTGKWIPISYTVKFDGSEGTGSVADISAKYGEEVTLPDNKFERVVTVTYDVNGGTEVDPDKVELEAAFNGWKKENSGDAVAAGTKVSNLTAEDGETVTYYADWKYRSTTTPTTAKPGYAFGGWSDGGKVTMEAGEEFTPTTDIELTAVWTANAYTITYNHNDVTSGDPTITTDTYTIEEALTLAEAPTREGYKFTGWELEKAVTEPVGNWDADTYSAAQTFEKGKYGNITLVAQWEEQYRYVLNFDANGGIGAPASITEEWCDDKEYTFTWTEVPTRTGYTFMGWAENAASEENVAGADKNSIKLDGEAAETVTKTIFAIWKRDTGTIQLNYSGGVPVVVTVTCTDAVNDEEKITINTVVTSNTTIKDLPTGTYKVTAESGNANYTAYVNPGSTLLKSGETANFDLSVSDEGFNWLTGFAHVINKRGG